MIRTVLRLALVVVLVALGWIAAKAQAPEPNFEILVQAPSGTTTIRCVRGCKLAWVERGVNPNSTPMQAFTFSCSGSNCSSGKVGGWIEP